MNKLTLLSFEKLFDQLSYEDCEEFLKIQLRKRILIIKDDTLYITSNKDKLTREYFDQLTDIELLKILSDQCNDFIYCPVCRMCLVGVKRLEHLMTHSRDEILETIDLKIMKQVFIQN